MTTLNDEVRQVVDSFVRNGELFTALDVSNKVKLTLPLARHSEVRDAVRDLFATVLQPASWAKTPIPVTLPNGETKEAVLYHPLSDSWDLDEKYDAQKRAQSSLRPVVGTAHVVAAPVIPTPTVPAPALAPTVVPPPLPAKDQWAQLFNTQPSLFPRR